MPDLTTALMMILLSSLTLAMLTGVLGREYRRQGSWQLTLSLAIFGVSYCCMSALTSPARHAWLGCGYVLFSYAICASKAALFQFYGLPSPRWILLTVPLCIGAAYALLLDQPDTRTRTVCGMLALQNLWIAHVLLRRRRTPLNRGEVVHLLGICLVTLCTLLRVVHPQTSLSALQPDSSSAPVLVSYAVFFIALHLKAIGFLMMANTRSTQHLTRFAYEDSLTGLPNRRSVLQFLQQALAEVSRSPQRKLSVLMIDIDHFKRINDQWGHPAGDQVLTGLGQVLQHKTRPLSVAGRYGGEEFLVVCPDTTGDEAMALAQRLGDEVRTHLRSSDTADGWPITISVGISTTPFHTQVLTDTELLVQADQALYQAKHAGRDRACCFGTSPAAGAEQSGGSSSGPDAAYRSGAFASTAWSLSQGK